MSTVKLENITDQPGSVRRRYNDACGAAHALDLVGERWALLVIRELMLGPKRFGALRSGLPGLSANVLAQRLESLEAAGVVRRRRLPPPASTQVYELTPWGYESEPIFQALGRWAARSPAHDPTLPLSAASFFLSLRTMFDAERAGTLEADVGFRVGDESVLVRVADEVITFGRDSLDSAEVVFTGSAETLAGAVYGGQPLSAIVQGGALKVEGDQRLAERFVDLFHLPPKVGLAPPGVPLQP